nr:proton channel OtopLc-like isoform X4 [Cherax quadricarinatus]
MGGKEGAQAGGGPCVCKRDEEDPVGDADRRDSQNSQQISSSLPSLQESSGSLEGEATPPAVQDKPKARVEGRRGRNWWEWKAAEQRKMQSGDEGDDELTSLESETLKRRAPLPKIRENLPEPDGGCDSGYGKGGSGGGWVLGGEGAEMGGARGPSSGGGGSPGVRVKCAAQPPLLHQPRHQPLLLQHHHFLPHHQQPHTRGGAPGPLASQSAVGSGAPRYTTSHAPPTPAQPNDQPKKVTITSFNQPKLTLVVPPKSEPPTPSPDKKQPPLTAEKTTPVHDTKASSAKTPSKLFSPPEKHLPSYPDKDSPLSLESPPPSAPPKDLVYADARNRKAVRGQHHHKYSSRKQEKPLERAQDLPEEVPAAAKSQPGVTSSAVSKEEPRDKSCEASHAEAKAQPSDPVKQKGGAGVSEKDTHTLAVWRPQPGGGAKYGPPEDKKRASERGSGSLVWVNLPGGGSKLEWMPTPALVTIKSTPALPNRDRPYQPPHKHNDSAVGAAPATDARGRGSKGGGGAQPASGERVTRAISAVPRASDVGVTAGVHESPGRGTPGTRVQGVLKQPSGSPSSHSAQPKNGVASAPGATHRSEGRGTTDSEEGTVLTVAGRSSGQVVRIRVRPEVHAYLTGLPTTYIAANIHAATASGRRDSHQDSQSSSGSALTGGSDGGGEGSTGYHEHDYEEVVDEYTLLRRAVDDHDPEAMQLLAAAEAAINPDIPARPHDPEGGGGSEYPYLREMKERLLLSRDPPLASMDESSPHDATDNQMLEVHQTPVGTVVKLNADGYGSHTSPTHRVESYYTGTLESRRGLLEYYPKNAKTSTFITLSLLYATLLVVVCLGFVLSEVLTHNVPLYYYEAFFTYLYGLSILFLLYVFCYLLSDSARDRKPQKPQGHHSGQYNVSEYEYYAYNEKVRQPEGIPDGSPTQEKLTSSSCSKPRKHKTSDNEHSHGSFFLRIGAIAFGLGTMIYNGLEFGVFFEIPITSPCYQILRGVNPLLQLVFTFMQMYFIFMNARLNIHKFKFLARFGLMHIVATNLCVWVRTLVRESLKEINEFRVAQGHKGEDYMILEGIRRALENRGLMAPNKYLYNLDDFVEMQEINETMQQASGWANEEDIVNRTCERVEIMGSIVSDSAPYLYPFIVEYSLIGAAVLYIMWKHIGRNPRKDLPLKESYQQERFVYDPEVPGDGMSVVSRRCHSRVDCVGASKGLFCGLLVLVASLICLILFFVLVNREELKMLAIYLADCSHCGIMFFSIIAMFIGFVRVRQLKFHGEREEELDDILLMVSAFGLFAYAVFSTVAGSLSAYTKEPNLLVMVTGILSVLQVIIQMVFIKDTQRRQVSLPEHERTKPGRQVVTFLLICNLTMWVIYTFETQKVEANPVQLEFFGDLPWTILLRCTLPLAIFHRFHSTVVLAAIWKNSYKTRIE